MIGVLIVTHGEIGTALLESSRQILGVELPQVATLSVWRQDDPDDLILRAGELIFGREALGSERSAPQRTMDHSPSSFATNMS